MRPAVRAPGRAGGTAMVIISRERLIMSAAGFLRMILSVAVNMSPTKAMADKAPFKST
jgi:hypothetical protein